jgi:hypothetical protein
MAAQEVKKPIFVVFELDSWHKDCYSLALRRLSPNYEDYCMKKLLLTTLTLGVLVFASQSAMALMSFTGSLSTPSGIIATVPWSTEGMIVNWHVYQNADLTWQYEYTFRNYAGSAPSKAISHYILEISPNAYREDFWGGSGSLSIDTYSSANPSNPGMPSSMYGLKIDAGGSPDFFYFTSTRGPVWGDFYMKDGKQNQSDIYAYNAGFGTADPLDAPSNGSIGNKILRPDTYSNVIPEPSTLLLFGSALALAGGWRKFRK